MALTPEQIAQLRGEAGLSPTPPTRGVNPDNILAQRRAKLGITEVPEQSNKFVGGVAGKVLDTIIPDIKKRGEAVYGAITGTSPESQGENALVRGVQATGEAFGAIADVGMDTVGAMVPQGVKDRFAQQTEAGKDNPLRKSVSGGYSEAMDKIGMGLDDLINRFPNIGQAVESALKTLGAGGEIAGNILGAEGVATGAQNIISKGKKAFTEIPGEIKTAIKGTPEGMATEAAGSDLTKINEMISPKPTIKQAKLAMTEGRLQEPTKGGIIKEGQPGRISPSDQNVKSSFTIKKYVPDAAKMEPTELYKTLETKVGDISKKLKPEMQKVKIKPETFDKMSSDWKAAKASQVDDAYMPADVNLQKLHSDFETRIKNIRDGSIDDIWEARKAYDGSVPSNVKEATELSSESLQAKKDIWLENRRIFSDAINDAENGLGQTSRSAFSDMRDMYEAQNGLLSKAKVVKERGPSFVQTVKKTLQEHPVESAVGTYIGNKALKETTGIGF